MVIKLGGVAVEDPTRAGPLLRALAGLHASHASGVIIVHGGGKAVDEHLARLGVVSERRDGLRVTSDAEIGEVAGVLAGKVNKGLAAALTAMGVRAVGLCLGDGAACAAARHTPGGVDLGRVGRITGGDGALLRALLRDGFLPVIAPIAYDSAGGLLNINGDDAAAGVARTVGASLLVLLTDVTGVLDERKQLIPTLDEASIDRLIASGVISGGMIPKVRAALEAARSSGAPALIASWNDAGAIANLSSLAPRGTLIRPALTSGGGS
jgi:acetylglutamate kinase